MSTDYRAPGEFPNGNDPWGSSTIREFIMHHPSYLVVCCIDCGRTLRQIIKVRGLRRGRRDHVVVASRNRVEITSDDGTRPLSHLLLIEMTSEQRERYCSPFYSWDSGEPDGAISLPESPRVD